MEINKFYRKDIENFFYWTLFDEYTDSKEYKNGFLKLDIGESTYDLPKSIWQGLKNLPVKYYPGISEELTQLIAKKDKVKTDQIFLGNGSKDNIVLINRLFLDPGDKAIICSPTYPLYAYFIELDRSKVIDVPRRVCDYGIDIPAIKKAINNRTKYIMLDNPNNPFGSLITKKELKEILDLGIITVVDEAYYEMCGVSAVDLLPQYPNLIVLRTFSKIYALAGLRLGYSISSVEIRDMLVRVKTPHQITVVSQYIAKELMKKIDINKRAKDLIDGREYMIEELKKLSYLKVFDSQGAYVVTKIINKSVKADNLYQYCYDNKLLIKKMDFPTMGSDFIRFNVVPKDMAQKVVEILKKYEV